MLDERTILARITALSDMDKDGLCQEWRALFDSEPPGYGPSMMRKRLIYRIQELAYGGLPKATVERLSLPEILAPKLPEILAGARPMGPKGSCL